MKSDSITSKATELDHGRNEITRLINKLFTESAIAVLCTVSVIASLLAALMALMAWDDAKTAEITVRVELQEVREQVRVLNEDIAVRQIRTSKLEAWLKAHGVPVEEIQE